jgi:hypothetical protein
MNTGDGIISKIYAWTWHPGNSAETISDWIAFFALALIASYLWSTVIKTID